MIKRILWLSLIIIVVSCREKSISLKGDQEVSSEEFVKFFPEKKLPFKWEDTLLSKSVSDSFLISRKIVKEFMPDSLFQNYFGKKVNFKLYAIGRGREKDKEYYLFLKAVAGTKKIGFLAVFSSDFQFLSAIPLVKLGFESNKSAYGMVDSKFQISIYREKKTMATEVSFKRDVYIYNGMANVFTLILTEPNEEIIEDVINPLDTLASKAKMSGNYIKDKRNFISIRDGKTAKDFQFFIHFEKNNAACIGELKGVGRFIGKNKAEYFEHGNSCKIEFQFDANQLSIVETGGCGAYRDIKCLFEGTYPKKKQPKSKSKL